MLNVTEVIEHSVYESERNFKNSKNTDYNNHYFYGAPLKIGATEDIPKANAITDLKTWENGTYYYGIVYTNYTYGLSTFKYIEFEINGF